MEESKKKKKERGRHGERNAQIEREREGERVSAVESGLRVLFRPFYLPFRE